MCGLCRAWDRLIRPLKCTQSSCVLPATRTWRGLRNGHLYLLCEVHSDLASTYPAYFEELVRHTPNTEQTPKPTIAGLLYAYDGVGTVLGYGSQTTHKGESMDPLEQGKGQEPQRRPQGVTQDDLINWFTYHSPVGDQPDRYGRIREHGYLLAKTIMENTPPGPDQTAAIRKVREAVMTANQAIACSAPVNQAARPIA